MSSQSSYNEIKRSKVPHAKRKIKLRGTGEDDGKWYRCWNCGFTNKIDRNAVGDGSGVSYSIGVIGTHEGIGVGSTISVSGSTVIMGVGQESHSISASAVSGCSLCGSMNYK